MQKHELANLLNGREYRHEMTEVEAKQAKEDGLVVIYGYSDDNVELRGAWNDEIGAWDGTTFKINKEGPIKNDCDDDRCPYFKQLLKEAHFYIDAKWDIGEYSWFIESNYPFSPFEIMEDGENYCRGIVIDIKDFQTVTE